MWKVCWNKGILCLKLRSYFISVTSKNWSGVKILDPTTYTNPPSQFPYLFAGSGALNTKQELMSIPNQSSPVVLGLSQSCALSNPAITFFCMQCFMKRQLLMYIYSVFTCMQFLKNFDKSLMVIFEINLHLDTWISCIAVAILLAFHWRNVV